MLASFNPDLHPAPIDRDDSDNNLTFTFADNDAFQVLP
jgi:hypothetical protein